MRLFRRRNREGSEVVGDAVGGVEGADGLLDPPAGHEQLLLLGLGGLVAVRRLPQPVVGEVAQLLLDRPQLAHQLFHAQGRASSISSAGWRTVRPAAARCIAQPGFADATTNVASPAAVRIVATLRSRIVPESSGSVTLYAPPAPQHMPPSSTSTSSYPPRSTVRTAPSACWTWRRWHGSCTTTV